MKEKVYLASSLNQELRIESLKAKTILETAGFDVYYPLEYTIPNAWDYPNTEWGLMVFQNDIAAIDACDYLVLLTHGRNSTAGANWEAGYAFAKGKKVIVVEMDADIMSLMVANGRYATVSGLAGLAQYHWFVMPKTRTSTEQK
jgi:nucleoside 2-deoxyribosyltransferase